MNITQVFSNNSTIERKKSSKTTNMIKSTSFTQKTPNGILKMNLENGIPRATSSYSACQSPRSTSDRTLSVATGINWNTQLNSLDSSFNTAISGESKHNSSLKDDLKVAIGSKGRGKAEFLNPQSVCIANKLIYATDSNNHRIHVFTLDGEFKFSFGASQIQSTTSISLRRPIGITSCINEKKILIADYEHKCVFVYDQNGKYESKIGQTRLLGPKGICINKAMNNEVVIADCKANSIFIFSLTGKFIKRFGSQGSKNDNFSAPHYVACLSNAFIVVSDFYNHCIKVFNGNGVFQYSFGTHGSSQGQFNAPTGVCCDEYDNILVSDWGITWNNFILIIL